MFNTQLSDLESRLTQEQKEKRAKKIQRRKKDKELLEGVRRDKWRKWL